MKRGSIGPAADEPQELRGKTLQVAGGKRREALGHPRGWPDSKTMEGMLAEAMDDTE